MPDGLGVAGPQVVHSSVNFVPVVLPSSPMVLAPESVNNDESPDCPVLPFTNTCTYTFPALDLVVNIPRGVTPETFALLASSDAKTLR